MNEVNDIAIVRTTSAKSLNLHVRYNLYTTLNTARKK